MVQPCESCPGSANHEARIAVLENDGKWFKEAIAAIKENTDELVTFARNMTRVEERQLSQGQAIERAFGAIETQSDQFTAACGRLDERLKALEKDAPINRLASHSLIEGAKKAVGIILLVGLGIVLGRSVT